MLSSSSYDGAADDVEWIELCMRNVHFVPMWGPRGTIAVGLRDRECLWGVVVVGSVR